MKPKPVQEPFLFPAKVRSYDIGLQHRLTVPYLLQLLHESAQHHASSVNFSYEDLQKNNKTWALVSIHLHLFDLPSLGEEVEARTSIAKYGGPLVYRDYQLWASDELLVSGQSLWALIDLKTRKTTRPSLELRDTLSNMVCPMQNDVSSIKRIGVQEFPSLGIHYSVRLHDCDFNGHLNNVVMVRWMLDAYALNDLSAIQNLRQIHFSYHQEALLGEGLVVHGMPTNKGFEISLVNNNTSQTVASGILS